MIWSAADLRALEGIRVGESDVVYAFVSLEGEPSAFDEDLLDDEERGRAERFVRPTDRHRFVLAHSSLRSFLALALAVEPAAVRYEAATHGKPGLAPGLPRLEFNMSHSEDLGLLAVARGRAVGVDVEHVRELPDAMSIADTHFTATESERLRSMAPPERQLAFFRYWARKEAVIKAAGEGLGRALDSFDVDESPEGTEWFFRDLPSPAGYAAAGAVSARKGARVEWRELSIELPEARVRSSVD